MAFRSVIVLMAIFSLVVSINESALGQRAGGWLNQPFRYLGGGQSTGYHWRTPGPCIDYYNPYSYNNTVMRSGGIPQGAASYIARFGLSGGYHHSRLHLDTPLGTSQFDTAPQMSPGAHVIQAELDDRPDSSERENDFEQPWSILDDDQESSSDLDDNASGPAYFDFGGSGTDIRNWKYQRTRSASRNIRRPTVR